MRFDIVTIFPGFFSSVFEYGIVRRAQAEGLVEIALHDLRDYAHDRHRTVDDRPFGGGEGMVLKPEPLAEALEALGIRANRGQGSATPANTDHSLGAPAGIMAQEGQNTGPSTPVAMATSAQDDSAIKMGSTATAQDHRDKGAMRVILLSAQGRVFSQAVARELAELERVVLICGRYEGVDERINDLYCDMELSIGDYVLSGGELAAAVVIDAAMRLLPGVLGNAASGVYESFGAPDAEIAAEIAAKIDAGMGAEIALDVDGVPRSQHGAGGLLDYPHYTRPAEFQGLRAPEVLLHGDHAEIRRWRREQQLRKTLRNRPDLLLSAALSDEDRRLLDGMREPMRE